MAPGQAPQLRLLKLLLYVGQLLSHPFPNPKPPPPSFSLFFRCDTKKSVQFHGIREIGHFFDPLTQYPEETWGGWFFETGDSLGRHYLNSWKFLVFSSANDLLYYLDIGQ